VYFTQGRYAEAEQVLKKVIDIKMRILGKDHPDLAIAISNLGMVYQGAGRYDEAETLYKRSLELMERAHGVNHPDVAKMIERVASLYQAEGRYKEAEKLFTRAFEIENNSLGSSHPEVALILNNLAWMDWLQGKPENAMSKINQALKALSIADEDEAYSFQTVPITIDTLRNQLYILTSLSEDNPIFIAESFNAAKVALSFLERYRGTFESQISKLLLWEYQGSIFELALKSASLMKQKQGYLREEAFFFVESSLSRSFSEVLAERFVDSKYGLPNKIVEQENAFYQKRRLLQKNILETQNQSELERIRKSYIENEKEFGLFLDKLHEDYPFYAQVNYPRPVPLGIVKEKLLTAPKVALAYYLGEDKSFVLVISNEKFDLLPINITKAEAAEHVKALRNALLWYEENDDNCSVSIKSSTKTREDLKQVNAISQKLYNKLIQPVTSFLTEKKELVIIPYSTLWLLPFEILSNANRKLLGSQFLIAYQNSFSVWSLNKTFAEDKPLNTKTFVGIGDAIYEKDHRFKDPDGGKLAQQAFVNEVNTIQEEHALSSELINPIASRSKAVDESLKACSWQPLNMSKEEIEQIQALSSFKDASETRLGFSASEWNLNNLDPYKYVHFSVHGSMRMKINGQNTQPALILTQKNPPDSNVDGLLTMEEVMNNLKLNADLVVLSACDTGIGEVLGGEGVMSMTRAFQYAGAGAVLTSLWKVHEDATKQFMVQFYSYLDEGKEPKEALYLTKQDFQQKKIISSQPLIDYSHPFFWGAFVLVGGN
ncbi:MAG: CHAT domain-containing protein, partial [Deltaproteobacteria bacterium]|nr:CHAT domain-containing protein [Deltaproteobacteria bacterium]